jgi:hypothetical protein
LRLLLYKINSVFGIAKEEADNKKLIVPEYHKFLSLFAEVIGIELYPYQLYNHKITLKQGLTPLFDHIDSLAKNELEVLETYEEKNFVKAFVRLLSLPASTTIIFIQTTDRFLKQFVNYRRLNEGTIKIRYLLPLFYQTLN